MIRIKAYNFRQAFQNVIYILMFFIVIILILFFLIIIAYFLKKEFEESIMNYNNGNIQITSSKSTYINKILKNELSIFIDTNIEKNIVSGEQIFNEEFTKNLNKNEMNLELKEISEIDYEIPRKFEVKVLENGKIKVGNVKISNYSNLNLNLDTLSKPLELKVDSNTDFLIYHTHATECYTVSNREIENYRTTNSEYNMIAIGKTLENELKKRDFSTLHDTILHDYPNYNGSYAHSLETVTKYIRSKNFDFILDIHRDAISSDLTYGPVCEIEGEKVAQLMFVVGTNSSGLKHDEWMKNLKLALMIQNRANEMYPGLFRDINLSKSRYNQHVSNGALIIEVGTTGNTLDEAKNSMKYLANVIESFK